MGCLCAIDANIVTENANTVQNPFVRILGTLNFVRINGVSYKNGSFGKGKYIADDVQISVEHSLCWNIGTSGVRL